MAEILHVHDFVIDTSKIPTAVIEQKCNSISKKRKTEWKREFGSEYNFLVLLFHLVFIEKLEESEIYNILGYQNAENVHHLLYDLGWSYSPDYEQNILSFQAELENLKNDLDDAKRNCSLLDENSNEHIKLRFALERVIVIKKDKYLKLGFKSGEEYARTFYYLTHITRGHGLAPKEFIHLFGFPSISMAQHHLRDLGLNKTRKKGIEGKKQRESQDYEKTYHAGQIIRRKAQLKYYSDKISDPEEYFRRQISDVIYKFLGTKKLEIVVGVNTTVGLEIDIPIVIYNPQNHQIFRIAIEYNGPQHDAKKDMKKKNLLEQKGWIYLEIQDIPEYSNNRNTLNRKINDTCIFIKQIIDAGKL